MLTRLLIYCAIFTGCVLSAHPLAAQKRYNIWPFGKQAGLDFNTSPPQPLEFKTVQGKTPPYYTTSVCDPNGILLFYTNGNIVWDATHKEMRKFRRWPWGGNVMPLICPSSGNDSIYYLFGVSDKEQANRLQYVKIYLPTATARPEVVPEPGNPLYYGTLLLPDASLLVAGTAHCNEKDTWIIGHSGNTLNAYLVTDSGVATSPVVSMVPDVIAAPGRIHGGYGNMKFSANGERMALPLVADSSVAVFDFDKATGRFSQGINIPVHYGEALEDLELSPDGSKLYVGSYSVEPTDPEVRIELHNLYQYDLDAGSPEAIRQSEYRLNEFPDRAGCSPRSCFYLYRTMQLGPDGRIYVGMRDVPAANLDKTASIIAEPNKKGRDARYRPESFNLNRVYVFINYNYIRSGSFGIRENGIQVQKKTCSDQPVSFSLLFNRLDSVRWEFGDPRSGALNTSSEIAPSHRYPRPGLYKVQAILYTGCLADTAFTEVRVESYPSVKVPPGIRDTTICRGQVLQLNASAPTATAFLWENGLIWPNREIKEAGNYAVTVFSDCSYDRVPFTVKVKECTCQAFVPTAFTPDHDGLNDVFRPVLECPASEMVFRVFSRYGDKVFETRSVNGSWDGKIRSIAANAGVYAWTLEYRHPGTKEIMRANGTVVLMR